MSKAPFMRAAPISTRWTNWPPPRPPAPLVEAIRLLETRADARTRAHSAIEAEGSFWLDAATIETFSA